MATKETKTDAATTDAAEIAETPARRQPSRLQQRYRVVADAIGTSTRNRVVTGAQLIDGLLNMGAIAPEPDEEA